MYTRVLIGWLIDPLKHIYSFWNLISHLASRDSISLLAVKIFWYLTSWLLETCENHQLKLAWKTRKDIIIIIIIIISIEKCAMLIMRSRKRQMTEVRELPNQEQIRTLGEQEPYKYLGILEADTIKQAEMKERMKKTISKERENFSKPSYIVYKHLGCHPCKILGTIIEVNEGRT